MTRHRSVYRKVIRTTLFAISGVLLALLSGCKLAEVFSLSGPQSTMVAGGPVARSQWDLFMVTVYVTTGIFIVVGAVLAYAQIKFRARTAADEKAEPPPQGHGNPLVEIGLIGGSILLLVIIAIPTLQGIWFTHDVPEEERADAIDVTAIGYQWWFKFEYHGETVKLPTGGEEPLVTGNELVIPAGRPVRVHLRTIDVIHSFWVPKLAGKVDMIPNRANFLWMKADKPGYFYGQCAEYCGESHAIMRFRVIALPNKEYFEWLEKQKAGARTADAANIAAEAGKVTVQFAALKDTGPGSVLSASGEMATDPFAAWQKKQSAPGGEDAALIATGRRLFTEKTCVSCHKTRGHEGLGITGPDLTHVGSRSTIAAGVLENTPERMHQWIKTPDFFKPGNKMYYGGYFVQEGSHWKENIKLSDPEIDALVAYLQSLK